MHAFGDDPIEWRKMPKWWLGREGNWQAYELDTCSPHGGNLIAHFAGIADRGAAQGIRGLYVAAPREELPATAPGEFYWADLVGLSVVNSAGEPLGSVTELTSAGAHPVMSVLDGERHRLLPFVGDVVTEVDLRSRVIHVLWHSSW